MSEAQRVQVVTLQEKEYRFLKIAKRTRNRKSTFSDSVKRDQEQNMPDSATPYTPSSPKSGHSEKRTT